MNSFFIVPCFLLFCSLSVSAIVLGCCGKRDVPLLADLCQITTHHLHGKKCRGQALNVLSQCDSEAKGTSGSVQSECLLHPSELPSHDVSLEALLAWRSSNSSCRRSGSREQAGLNSNSSLEARSGPSC